MKKLGMIGTLLISALVLSTAYRPMEDIAITQQVKEASLLDLEACQKHIQELVAEASKQRAEAVISSFHKARRVYKRSEFILEYFHHSAITKHINGAPLPKVEEKVADLNILEPSGFQRLEELIYEDDPDFSEIQRLGKKLDKQLAPLINYHPRVKVYDRHVLEAMRHELVRIFTLGVTGFECPASDSALAESRQALIGMRSTLEHYGGLVSPDKGAAVEMLVDKGEKQLKGASFDSFDRMAFLMEVINPLYKAVRDIHLTLGIETLDEVNAIPEPSTYSASNLFEESILNKDYFLERPIASITEEQIQLGRLLFFDPALSYNNVLSCATCHQPEMAFTDGEAQSISNELGVFVDRNSPSLINSMYAHHFFHDFRADRLEAQIEQVMANEKEFNITAVEMVEKLKKSQEYAKLFLNAYPGMKDPIQQRTIMSSITAFTQTLSSFNSPFDHYVRGEKSDLSASAIRGFNLFMGKAACGTCHFAPTFAGLVPPFFDDSETEVLGVTATNDTLKLMLDDDPGRIKSGRKEDEAEFYARSFKTPSVRNVEVTAPYFHNGAYPTLEEVMWFYNRGGGAGLGLDVPFQTLPEDQLGLSEADINDIIAFMNALTDYSSFNARPERLPDFEGIAELQDR